MKYVVLGNIKLHEHIIQHGNIRIILEVKKIEYLSIVNKEIPQN